MNGLVWVHLSDWHQKGNDFGRKVVLDSLLADLRDRAQISPELAKVDFAVFSGDLAWQGNKEEYQAAQKLFLEPVLNSIDLQPNELFITPGNHDLNRSHIEEMLPPELTKPLSTEEQVQKWLTDDKRRERALEPFEDFSSFVSKFTGQNPPAYANTWVGNIHDKRVGILCLNSAWMCGRNQDESGEVDDYGKLVLGEPQIHESLDKIADTDVRIAVLHHPFEWLTEFDRSRVEKRLKQTCHFILRGHVHQPDFNLENSLSGECAVIPAGACFEQRTAKDARYLNAYNFVHLDFDTGNGAIFLRRWSERQNKWIEDSDSCIGGKFSFKLPKYPGEVAKSVMAVSSNKKTRKKNQTHGSAPKNVQINKGPIGVQNNYIGGSKTKPLAEISDTELLGAFQNYLSSVAEECSQLVTWGIPLPVDLQNRLRLAWVYAQLETTTPRPDKPNKTDTPLTAIEALLDSRKSRVVIVGEPGCGKSTLFQYVTLCLAGQLSGGQQPSPHLAGMEIPKPLLNQNLLPLRVVLRDFAAFLPTSTGTSVDVVNFLVGQLQKGSHDDGVVRLKELLRRGLAFVLFDGLDEVPKIRLVAVKQAITEFSWGDFQKSRVAVTCRAESYKLSEFILERFPKPHQIAPLTSALRRAFVQAWYSELEYAHIQFRGEARNCVPSLLNALDSERLDEMSRNPFFLTAMAALHRPDKPLPNTGAKLMHELVNGILEESRKRRVGANSVADPIELSLHLANIPNGFGTLRQRLEAIAFKAREMRKDHASRILDEDLLRQRLRLTGSVTDAWVNQLLEILRHRAGLIQSKDSKQFEFAHRFEEFLAGCFLTNDDQWQTAGSFAKRCDHIFSQQGDYARQVVLWAAGFNVYVNNRRGPVRDLVSLLVTDKSKLKENDLQRLELATDIIQDVGMVHWQHEDVPDAPSTVTRIRETLEIVRDESRIFNIKTRSRAASCIGGLGDPRSGVGLRADGLPDLDFTTSLLPKGPFQLKGGGEVAIPHPYHLCRYPITVAQFQAFVDQGGYGGAELSSPKPSWWSEEGWRWRNGEMDTTKWPDWMNLFRQEYQQESFPIQRPKNYSTPFQTPNHPRVGVSWFEAEAFCAWLTDQWRHKGVLKKTEIIRLPHEAEWEQAARWNGQQADNRKYPWGECEEKEIARYCNWAKTGLNLTSAVGLFDDGKTLGGVMDMSGNVWEWCENRFDEEDQFRVLRGGSWLDDDPEILSCAYRLHDHPGLRDRDLGFRCVLVAGGSAPG